MSHPGSAIHACELVKTEHRQGEHHDKDDEELDEVAHQRRLQSTHERVEHNDHTGDGDCPEEREAKTDTDYRSNGKKLEGVVEKLHRQTQPGKHLAHARSISRCDVVNRTARCRTTPTHGKKPRTNENGRHRKPAHSHRHPSILVGERGIHHKRQSREAVHVEADA